MALVNEHFLKLPGSYLFGYSEEGKYIQNNASEAGYYPVRYRRCHPAASQSMYRGYAQSSGRVS